MRTWQCLLLCGHEMCTWCNVGYWCENDGAFPSILFHILILICRYLMVDLVAKPLRGHPLSRWCPIIIVRRPIIIGQMISVVVVHIIVIIVIVDVRITASTIVTAIITTSVDVPITMTLIT